MKIKLRGGSNDGLVMHVPDTLDAVLVPVKDWRLPIEDPPAPSVPAIPAEIYRYSPEHLTAGAFVFTFAGTL